MSLIIPAYRDVARIGFIWEVEHYRRGALLTRSITHNIFPTEALNHMLSVVFASGTQQATWYMGIFETNTTPTSGTTYATPGWTETTSYSEAARPTITFGSVSSASIDNTASPASFTMTNGTQKTIYGGFVTNVATKGDTANAGGVIASAALFSTSKDVENTDVLKVKITLSLTSS